MTASTAATQDPRLARDLAALARPGLLVGHRVILPGDERALLEGEAAAMATRPLAARRASGAARLVARALMEQLDIAPFAVPPGPAGAPAWPPGIIGSLAHGDTVALAALARGPEIRGVGIDIEPPAPLPPEMRDLVVTAQEHASLARDPFAGRLLFAAKEAVYKAVQPLDGLFLEFHDITVNLAAGRAVVRNGRVVALGLCVSTHLVALAVV